MITIAPVVITGGPQSVDLTANDGCCALLQNESAYALEVVVGQTKRWLGAWIADLFDVPPGVRQVSWTTTLIGSLANAPSSSLLVTVAELGEGFRGTYPMALVRQAGVSAGAVDVGAIKAPPTPVVLETGSGLVLGDPSSTLLPDQLQAGVSVPIFAMYGALASFKAAAGQTIALVGSAGALTRGGNNSVSPAFGQATSAGNLLVAWATRRGGTDLPATTAAGWVCVESGIGQAAIFYKPNCGAAEAAPTFTCGAGSNPMEAQLAEFSGAATASPLDQALASDTTAAAAPLQATNPAADVADGDLVVGCVLAGSAASSTCVTTATYNNGASGVIVGNDDARNDTAHSTFSYAINPSAGAGLPLAEVPWPYDSTGVSAPAAGTLASATLAANPAKMYVCHAYSGEMNQNGAAADVGQVLALKDGASILAEHRMSVIAGAGNTMAKDRTGLAYRGTLNTAMSISFSGAGANTFESVSIAAYLR